MFPSIMICPATCELCGQWMPDHSDNCPRSGVHPSQWTLQDFKPESDDSRTDKESFVISSIYWPPTTRNMMKIKTPFIL